MDMEGVLRTAIKNSIEVLILGASGCGAFMHDPWREARLWSEVLKPVQHLFKEVVFAVLPDSRSPNVEAFSHFFGEKPSWE